MSCSSFTSSKSQKFSFQRHPALVAVGGPSGVGKTAVINELVQGWGKEYARPLSYTSRPRRPGEGDTEYRFTTREDIESWFQAGKVLNRDEAYGQLYAIDADSVAEILASGRSPIKEVHPRHHEKLRSTGLPFISVILTGPDRRPVPVERREADRLDYQNLGHKVADVLLRIGAVESAHEVALGLEKTLAAVTSTLHWFPNAGEIDATNRAGYSAVATEFQEGLRPTTDNFHALSSEFLAKALTQHIPQGSSCLELGPGGGWLRRCIAWPTCEYVSLEIAPNMIRELIRQGRGKGALLGSARSIPLEPCSLDAVISSLGDPYCYPAALCEVLRVLRPGGRFILTAPSSVWASAIREVESRRVTTFKMQCGSMARVHSFVFSRHDLHELLCQCGFEILEAEVATGRGLSESQPVSPAITRAADRLQIDVRDLEILNMVVAKKPVSSGDNV